MRANVVWTGVLFALLLPLSVYAFSVDLEYGWEADDVVVRQKAGYDYLGVDGSVYIGSSLGKIYEMDLLPEGYHIVDYEVVREEWEEIDGTYRIGIENDGVVARMMGDDHGGVEYVGSSDAFGYRMMMAVVKPMRVVDGRVGVLKRLDIRVDCASDQGDLRVERRSAVMDSHLGKLMAGIIGQPVEGYGSWGIQGYQDWVSEAPSLDGSVVDCVIVTEDSLAGEFERLAGFHDRLGIRTVVRTMSWIDSRYMGSDGAERVRNFLRDAYEKWGTAYALMGGAPDIVPMRYGWTNHYGGALIPTDVYYGNLEGSWNEDGDDIFGEFGNTPDDPGDDVTFYAQLTTGRAPVKMLQSLKAVLSPPHCSWAK
jgi:hypothetical protein